MKGFQAFVAKAYAAVKAAVMAYPGGVAAVLTIAVALAARLGLHVTANELLIVVSVMSAALGGFVHKTTVAKSALKGKEVK